MKKKKEELEEVVETEVEETETPEVEVEAEVETETEVEETETPEVEVEENQNGVAEIEPEVLTGVVTAAKLNVRELPNKASDVVCVISKDDVITIVTDTSQTYEDFYEVCTADGKLGFCMKQFIKLN